MLTATETGSLVGGRDAVPAVTVPLNAPRLQGTVSAKGIDDLFVWGSGVVGRLAFEPPLTDVSAIEVRPNLVSYTVAGGTVRIAALPDRPVIVVTHSGAATTVRLSPTRGTQPGMSTRFALTRFPGGWAADSEWAAALLTATDSTPGSRGRLRVARDANTVLALGSTRAEAAAAVEDVLADPAAALRSAEAYASRLETTLVTEDAVLNGMFTACLHAACSSRKELTGGRFAGYSAGTGYVMPPRTYFRDSYWTLQALLPFAPDQAVEQVRLLAGAVGGQAQGRDAGGGRQRVPRQGAGLVDRPDRGDLLHDIAASAIRADR